MSPPATFEKITGAIKNKINGALQVQYEVEKVTPDNGEEMTRIQGINIWNRNSLSGNPQLLRGVQHLSVCLVTKKQWALSIYWDKRRGTDPKNMVLLGWYILYYEHVLDELLDGNERPLNRWVEKEHNKEYHTPADDESDIGDADGEVDIPGLIAADPWNISHAMSLRRVCDLPSKVLEDVLDRIRTWLDNHRVKKGEKLCLM